MLKRHYIKACVDCATMNKYATSMANDLVLLRGIMNRDTLWKISLVFRSAAS